MQKAHHPPPTNQKFRAATIAPPPPHLTQLPSILCSRFHALLHTFPNIACAQQPKDFLLLRIRVEKVGSGETGYDHLAVRCRVWPKGNVTTLTQDRFGCVAHNVDHDILGLNSPSYQRTAGADATSWSPPGRTFARPFSCEATSADSKVLNLFGLRHCVTAAAASLTRAWSGERPLHVLKLGQSITNLIRSELGTTLVSAGGCRFGILGLEGGGS